MTDARRQVLARLPSIEWFQVSDDPTGVRRVSYARYSTDYGLVQLECRLNYRPVSNEFLNERIELIDQLWATGDYFLGRYLPTSSVDEGKRRAWARFERQSATPSVAMAILRMNAQIDARHILPAIRVPTLVTHRVGDDAIPVEAGQFLARNIAGAKYIELPGDNHAPFYEPEIVARIVGEAEEFLTGSRTEVEIDRVLATV